MSDTKYPPRGALFINRKKTSDKHPDMQGNLEISRELLGELVAQAKAGKPIKMDLSAWSKQSDKAGKWLSMSASKPYEKQEQARPRYSDDDAPF